MDTELLSVDYVIESILDNKFEQAVKVFLDEGFGFADIEITAGAYPIGCSEIIQFADEVIDKLKRNNNV